LAVTLQREGFSFRRNRYSQKKTGNRKGNRTITEEMLLYLELPLFL